MKFSKNVLLVEDNALLSILGEKIIGRLGFKVIATATSGEEAIEKVYSFNPDILVMDIQLSGTLDGIQTIEKLRNQQIDIPVIFLSGSNEQSLKERAREVNCIEYLVKPISVDVLNAPLRRAEKAAVSKNYFAA
ncbi:MAG: response regulator [Balneolaceae bacterium]